MEKTVEKSQEQADVINMIAIPVMLLDVEYCRELAKSIIEQGHRQDSMAVLNPSHSLIKNDVLREQGKALNFLCDYVDSLKEVERLKQQVKSESSNRAIIKSLFM